MLIVDPRFVPPPPPETLTSPDGVVSAKVDSAHAGVLLKADYASASKLPVKVRFVRGDGLVVMSGDPAYAPGGVAVAYDHEARPGGANSYHAVPIYTDGSEGAPSETVALAVLDGTDVRNVWVKNPSAPNLSMHCWVEEPPEVTRPARAQFADVVGASVGVATWDKRSGRTTQLQVVTASASEAASLEALLDSGPLLIQTLNAYDFPATYWLPGDWQRARVGRMTSVYSRWTVPLTECRRPSTAGAPLRIPVNTYAAVKGRYGSYAQLKAQMPSPLRLLGW